MIQTKHLIFFSLLAIVLSFSTLTGKVYEVASPYSLQSKKQTFVSADLIGQLGNQCFTLAAAISLALDNEAIPIFPDLVNKQNCGIPVNYEKIFFRLNTYPIYDKWIHFHYREPHFTFDAIPFKPNMKIYGYFQSENYFKHHKEKILELFAPSDEIMHYLQSKYQKILSHPCSVAIHMRSYLEDDPNQEIYPNYTRRYYENAVGLFPEDSLFVVFSNDMKRCKTLLKGLAPRMIFIENEPHYHDFYLMSQCHHQIIANSTFSWWAAYLNPNPEKIVVSPRIWGYKLDSKDLVPPEWIIIDEPN